MKISTDWLDELFELSYHEAWKRIFNEVSSITTTIDKSDIKGFYTKIEKEIGSIETILSQSAWDLWENFNQASRASYRVEKFWENTIGPKAVLILDSLSLREAGILLRSMPQYGLQKIDFSVAGSEIPSETDIYANAIGLPGRASLKKQSVPSSFKLDVSNCYVDSFKQIPFKDCINLVPTTPNLFIWHSWPDDSVHELDRVEDAMRRFIDHVDSILISDAFMNFLKKITQGRTLLITSDHGYCHSGSFQSVSGKAKDEIKVLGHKRAMKILVDEFNVGLTIPPILFNMKATSNNDNYRVVIGKRRPPDKGFPALTHGGLSLMECCIPLITLRDGNKDEK